MKYRFLFSLLLVSIALVLATQPGISQIVGNADDLTIVMYPTGIHPADVNNVQ